MCEVLDRMFKNKDAEIAKLKQENSDKDAKLADKDAKIVAMIKSAMKRLNISVKEAMDFLNIPEADCAALMLRL